MALLPFSASSFNMVRKVAVIGAGPSGLTSIKACLDEGLVPVCFESSDDMGGLWKFKASQKKGFFFLDDFCLFICQLFQNVLMVQMFFLFLQEVSEPNRASIYRSLTINISKEMMCYSDFPIPADYPNYMHHSKIIEYFRMYASHFKLLQHVRFQVTILRVG